MSKHPNPIRVIEAKHPCLLLEYSDGSTRSFDVTDLLGYPFFEPLRQEAFFRLARVEHRTVVWPGDIDIAPETLWLDSVELV